MQADCFKVKTKKRYKNQGQPQEAVILVVQDHFTKYVWLRVLPSQDGIHVAQALYDIFADFQCPATLHTDNGSEFINRLVESLDVSLHYSAWLILCIAYT